MSHSFHLGKTLPLIRSPSVEQLDTKWTNRIAQFEKRNQIDEVHSLDAMYSGVAQLGETVSAQRAVDSAPVAVVVEVDASHLRLSTEGLVATSPLGHQHLLRPGVLAKIVSPRADLILFGLEQSSLVWLYRFALKNGLADSCIDWSCRPRGCASVTPRKQPDRHERWSLR